MSGLEKIQAEAAGKLQEFEVRTDIAQFILRHIALNDDVVDGDQDMNEDSGRPQTFGIVSFAAVVLSGLMIWALTVGLLIMLA